jgi:hypothetical protein
MDALTFRYSISEVEMKSGFNDCHQGVCSGKGEVNRWLYLKPVFVSLMQSYVFIICHIFNAGVFIVFIVFGCFIKK